MALRSIIEKTWNRNILFSALVELTYRCNLDCFFCYNDLGLTGRPLDDEQYFQLFEDLAAMQVMNLTFTGGEPLAHPSFLAFGRRARELGFVVRIKSNGHALRGDLARRVREEVDPFLIDVSLHGAHPETHDRQTRVAGSFERLVSNLRELRSLGLRVKLNGTLTRWNEDELEAMFELADSLGVRLAMTPTVTPRDDGDTSPLQIRASDEGIRRLYRLLDARCPDDPENGEPAALEASGTCTGEPEGKKNCGAGASGIAVDPYGNVYPCVQWRRPLGSLHEGRIGEIWHGSAELGEIRRLNAAAKEMMQRRGEEVRGMAHCLGLSEEKTGDPLADDPDALANTRLLHQVQGEKKPLLPIIS